MGAIKDFAFWSKNTLLRHKATEEYKCSLRQLKLGKEELAELNFAKRKAIVEHAYNHSLFYHGYYDAEGFHPSQLRQPADWEKVPVVEKEMIRKNSDRILTADLSLMRANTTSGSTGEPLVCYHDSRFNQEILEWRMLKLWNVSPACNMAKIWRIPDSWLSPANKLKNKIIWFPTKRIQMEATGITPHDIIDFIRRFNRTGGIINGYAGSIAEMSRHIVSGNMRVTTPKLIIAFASPLSATDRQIIGRAFGTDAILDLYCCNEVSFIAFSCHSSADLHINWDYRHIDIADGNKLITEEGRIGDVLLTDLTNFGFPIIKYRVGDKSCLVGGDCSCGCRLPRMSPVKGRITDNLITPGGGFVSGEWLTTIFDDCPNAITSFQIRQKKDFSVELLVVPNNNHTDSDKEINAVADNLRNKTSLPVKLVETTDIPSDRGKHRYIISEFRN